MSDYALAVYPKNVVGARVSPTKICIQYGNPEVKLRLLGSDRSQLPKLPNCDRALPVPTKGIDMQIVAVGCQMPELEAMHETLCKALVEYGLNHSDIYKKTYGKSFMSALLTMSNNLDNVLDKLYGRN